MGSSGKRLIGPASIIIDCAVAIIVTVAVTNCLIPNNAMLCRVPSLYTLRIEIVRKCISLKGHYSAGSCSVGPWHAQSAVVLATCSEGPVLKITN